MMKRYFLVFMALLFLAPALRCGAQDVASVIYLSPAETARAKHVAHDLTNAQGRQAQASTAWSSFYQRYQAAHPEMPHLQFTSDFRFAFAMPSNLGGSWDVNRAKAIQLSAKERKKAEALQQAMMGSWRALSQARNHWSDFQYELVSDHFPNAKGGQVVTLSRGKSVTLPARWASGIVFMKDFRVAVPAH